jgi:hypothetical protein
VGLRWVKGWSPIILTRYFRSPAVTLCETPRKSTPLQLSLRERWYYRVNGKSFLARLYFICQPIWGLSSYLVRKENFSWTLLSLPLFEEMFSCYH